MINDGRGKRRERGREEKTGNENKGMNKCKLHDIQNNEREHLRETGRWARQESESNNEGRREFQSCLFMNVKKKIYVIFKELHGASLT